MPTGAKECEPVARRCESQVHEGSHKGETLMIRAALSCLAFAGALLWLVPDAYAQDGDPNAAYAQSLFAELEYQSRKRRSITRINAIRCTDWEPLRYWDT